MNNVLDEQIVLQRKKLRELARRLLPHATDDDLLNPYDFPELIGSSQFNYEDGYLAGLLAAQMALGTGPQARTS